MKTTKTKTVNELIHDMDVHLQIAIDAWSDALLTRSQTNDPKLDNDDQFRGYIKALKWWKEKLAEYKQ